MGSWGSNSVLEHKKGYPSQPWVGREPREGFLEEVMPVPSLRKQEGESQTKGVDRCEAGQRCPKQWGQNESS